MGFYDKINLPFSNGIIFLGVYMGKKKNSNLGKIISLVAIVLGIVAVCMLFAPAAVAEALGQKTSYSGANLAFGYTYKTEVLGNTVETEIFNASANIVTYILVLVGIVFAVLSLLGKLGKIAPFISAAAFLIAGIFFFCSVAFCSPYTNLTGDAKTEYVKGIRENLSLGAGAIVGGILSILAAISSAAAAVVAKK